MIENYVRKSIQLNIYQIIKEIGLNSILLDTSNRKERPYCRNRFVGIHFLVELGIVKEKL